MAISLRTNVAAMLASNRINSTADDVGKVYARLSSGLRIVRPGDDPAGNQVADALKADARLAATAIQNASSAISFTSIADAALSGVSDLLTRMAELAEQSANGVYANSQRLALANEFSALGSEVERIAQVTKFNGVALLSNSQSVDIQIGIDGNANSRISLNTINGTLAALGLASAGSSTMSFSIIAGSDTDSQEASRNALNAVTAAIDSLNSTRGSLGAVESRLNTAISYLTSVREEFTAAESRIRDVDVAAETANLVRLQVLQQAQAAVLGQANQVTSIALALLG